MMFDLLSVRDVSRVPVKEGACEAETAFILKSEPDGLGHESPS